MTEEIKNILEDIDELKRSDKDGAISIAKLEANALASVEIQKDHSSEIKQLRKSKHEHANVLQRTSSQVGNLEKSVDRMERGLDMMGKDIDIIKNHVIKDEGQKSIYGPMAQKAVGVVITLVVSGLLALVFIKGGQIN